MVDKVQRRWTRREREKPVRKSRELLQALQLKKLVRDLAGGARWRGNQLLPHYDLRKANIAAALGELSLQSLRTSSAAAAKLLDGVCLVFAFCLLPA